MFVGSQNNQYGLNNYIEYNHYCGIAGIYETNLSVKKTLFFPNPFSSKTDLNPNIALENATLTLYNSLGNQLKQFENISGQTFTLFRNTLTSGLYFAILSEDNIVIAIDKLTISK